MTQDELISKTDKAIGELVLPKKTILKAYNYYNGIRDPELFRYLEENFGLGNPTSIEFTPLIRKHIDALVGEYLGMPIIPKVLCKDSITIQNIGREKQLKIVHEVQKLLEKNLKNDILNYISGKKNADTLIEELLNSLKEELDTSFVSEYEIAALNVIEYIMLSRTTDMTNVLRQLLLDLLITGLTYYTVVQSESGVNIKILPLDPNDVFIEINPESPYIKDAYRAVIRHYMSKDLILHKYGKDLSKKDIEKIKEHWDVLYDLAAYYMKTGIPGSKGILAGEEAVVTGRYIDDSHYNELIPIYEVQWIETDSNFVMLRYETIRIGEDIYILKGKNEDVIRSKDNPNYCGLSVNGVHFLNRGNKPFSLVLACASLLDRYDILNFYRDRLIASSGTTGDFVDVSLLPTFLGLDLPERLLKFIAYKKGGIAPIDSSLPGRLETGLASMNTIFNGFDDTLKAQAVQAILIAIESIEKTVSDITGVFRERLGGILQRDAVSNILQGVNNSFIITKQYYHQMDLIVNEILLDCLNLAKKVFKEGLTGSIILGNKYLKIFTALPEHFTLTDYDIRILTSSDIIKDTEYIRLLIPELSKSGMLDPEIIIDAITCKSLTDLKSTALRSIRKKKLENNQLQLLQLQLLEANELMKLMEQLLKEASLKVEELNEEKMKLELQKLQLEHKVDWFKAQTDRTYKTIMAEEAKRRTDAEIAQLYDGNPYNDEIKDL